MLKDLVKADEIYKLKGAGAEKYASIQPQESYKKQLPDGIANLKRELINSSRNKNTVRHGILSQSVD